MSFATPWALAHDLTGFCLIHGVRTRRFLPGSDSRLLPARVPVKGLTEQAGSVSRAVLGIYGGALANSRRGRCRKWRERVLTVTAKGDDPVAQETRAADCPGTDARTIGCETMDGTGEQ